MRKKIRIMYSHHAESRIVERGLSRADVTRMIKVAKPKLKHREITRISNPANDLFAVVVREHNNIVVKSVYQAENKKYDLKVVK